MKIKKYAGINITSILEEAEVFLLIEKRVSVYNFKKLTEFGTNKHPPSSFLFSFIFVAGILSI